jgi:hypothetical protein
MVKIRNWFFKDGLAAEAFISRVLMRRALALTLVLAPQLCHARTDPNLYQTSIASEIRPYLIDCQKYGTFDDETDTRAVAECRSAQATFADEYYKALEGNQADKYDVAFFFERGDLHGVRYNPTMSCAWFIEAAQTGGRLPAAPFDAAILAACMQSGSAVLKAAELHAEEDRVANLTY